MDVMVVIMGLAMPGEPGLADVAPQQQVPAKVLKVIKGLADDDLLVRVAALGKVDIADPGMEEAADDIASLLLTSPSREVILTLEEIGFAASYSLRHRLRGHLKPKTERLLVAALWSVATRMQWRLDEGKPQPGRPVESQRQEAALARQRCREVMRDGVATGTAEDRLAVASWLEDYLPGMGLLPLLADRVFRETDKHVKRRLLKALWHHDRTARYVRSVYVELVKGADEDLPTARTALLMLAFSGPRTLPESVALLRHRSPRVRSLALSAVAFLDHHSFTYLPRVLPLGFSPEPGEQSAAWRCVARVCLAAGEHWWDELASLGERIKASLDKYRKAEASRAD